MMCLALGAGCQNAATRGGGWLPQEPAARWDAVARHLRGLDVAMVEIGYRYGELYWGGRDRNWSYADYQVQKIRLALENALERRPKRRASTESTFTPVLDEVARVVEAHDAARFGETFDRMTAACNACHAAENVSSFYVVAPKVRYSPIRSEPDQGTP
jgi:hypothetical protein